MPVAEAWFASVFPDAGVTLTTAQPAALDVEYHLRMWDRNTFYDSAQLYTVNNFSKPQCASRQGYAFAYCGACSRLHSRTAGRVRDCIRVCWGGRDMRSRMLGLIRDCVREWGRRYCQMIDLNNKRDNSPFEDPSDAREIPEAVLVNAIDNAILRTYLAAKGRSPRWILATVVPVPPVIFVPLVQEITLGFQARARWPVAGAD